MKDREKELILARLQHAKQLSELTAQNAEETRKILNSPIIRYAWAIEIFFLLAYVFALGCWGYIIGELLKGRL